MLAYKSYKLEVLDGLLNVTPAYSCAMSSISEYVKWRFKMVFPPFVHPEYIAYTPQSIHYFQESRLPNSDSGILNDTGKLL